MNLPQPGDYINIHTHGSEPAAGIFIVENLMAHEGVFPLLIPGTAFSFGIHPWYLNKDNYNLLISSVEDTATHSNLIAIGEAGFDKLRGPYVELQRLAFEKQIVISERVKKPVIIHCVRWWDELLSANRKLKPNMPWLIHGFRGNIELASQLISKGMFLSFWFDFIIKPEAGILLRSLPKEKIFLETDGADIDIRGIYNKVAGDLQISVNELKSIILSNYNDFFKTSK
jgi:TatD DNase family protein